MIVDTFNELDKLNVNDLVTNQNKFALKSNFIPTGDQPSAIKELISGINNNEKDQVLLGVTGSGKTFTMAHVINSLNRPSLLMAPNKTLAAQLYGEMKDFFPNNAVEYFVSYYDYYQPEAYVPRSDTFIEKLKQSSKVELTFTKPTSLLKILDIQSDSFKTEGLNSSYSLLDNSCPN